MTDSDPSRSTGLAPHTDDVRSLAGLTTTRRQLLGVAGGVGAVSLAGCLGILEGGGSAPNEPVDPPDEAACGVCKMKPANHPEWNAQFAFGDGTRVHFCSPGCHVAFYADPGRFMDGRSREDIETGWVTDYTSKEWTDAMDAVYVLEMNPDRIEAPMMKNPVPFETQDDATAYVEQYDDLGPDDIVGIDAFDVSLAKQYRGRFFE